ncbi:uncharacterized protein LOC21396204 isoform X2 [Morus notabilis]|uniref:uncharacterized protein LOC21396204 isoform X2 n=1 Tax=Morus notabilis TaxID=981085 RepID=UPI000CECEE21|nr:uncharacterized protein LOC21396204 isoform X2 [Morus notabilis]
MSRRQEKRRKFNEAVINMLYPPPPPQARAADLAVNNFDQDFDSDLVSDSFEESSSSTSGDDGESESRKLTRAQRKRLRRKKLKTDASRRGKIIGPLLPAPADDDGNLALENGSPTVRRNAAEKPPSIIDHPDEPVLSSGEPPTCAKNQSKVKIRRLVKKLARKNSLAPREENFDQDQSVKSIDEKDGAKDCKHGHA